MTSIADLRPWVEDRGYHCAGRSVPGHICDPMMEEDGPPAPADHAAVERADEAHGHGGHAGMSMDTMERDMRNRFLVALIFTVPTLVWSPVGDTLFGSMPAVPFWPRHGALAVPAQRADRALSLGFHVEIVERLKWGIVERVAASKARSPSTRSSEAGGPTWPPRR
ncbi:MAG: hypothetical protein H0T69_17180, partial [Thermoleophilaceae bacterium]|nr:hypothetical protein [Thermoleophilaceae bacterium]